MNEFGTIKIITVIALYYVSTVYFLTFVCILTVHNVVENTYR